MRITIEHDKEWDNRPIDLATVYLIVFWLGAVCVMGMMSAKTIISFLGMFIFQSVLMLIVVYWGSFLVRVRK